MFSSLDTTSLFSSGPFSADNLGVFGPHDLSVQELGLNTTPLPWEMQANQPFPGSFYPQGQPYPQAGYPRPYPQQQYYPQQRPSYYPQQGYPRQPYYPPQQQYRPQAPQSSQLGKIIFGLLASCF